jgi:asparagine synthase (glutamine-hydrolysing)
MLDHPLLENLFSLPARFHMKDGRSKSVLRAAMTGSLPEATLGRKKMGFAAPLHHWFSPRSGQWASDMIRSGAAVELGLLRPDAIDQLRAMPEWLWAAKVWVLLILETWARKYAGRAES